MCLIAFAYEVHPEFRLILAANRDEFYHRPATHASVWPDAPHVFGGRDKQAGGSWLGVTRDGRLAALTNYRAPDTQSYPMSRGQLVADYLTSTQGAQEYATSLVSQGVTESDQYAGFNLLIFDREHIHWLSNRSSDERDKVLAPGVYGLSNHLLDTPWPKTEKVKNGLSTLLKNPDTDPHRWWPDIKKLFQDSTEAEDSDLPDTGVPYPVEKMLSSVFIKSAHYGTRATTLVCITHKGDIRFFEQTYLPQGLPGDGIEHHWSP